MVLLSSFSDIPVAEGLQGLTKSQKLAHRYHTINSNFDGTLNGALESVFATTADNNCYTYSGMLKQTDKKEFVKAMLVETAVLKNEAIGPLFYAKICLLEPKPSFLSGPSSESDFQMAHSLNTKLDYAHMVECKVGE